MSHSDDRRSTLQQLRADAATGPPYDEAFLNALRADVRIGAQQLLLQCERAIARHAASQAHDEAMLQYEREAWAAGHARVAGVDEAGRGPLAGPIVAAAVVLGDPIEGLNDSKLLSAAERDTLYRRLHDDGHAIGVATVSAQEIDANGIQPANYRVMLDAAAALAEPPDFLLIDGFNLPACPFPQRRLIKGDRRSASIAAASIVAKVWRDRLMEELDAQYPEYGFARHKGYGTKQHLEALARYGPCPSHRRSFSLGARHRKTAVPPVQDGT